MIGIGLVMSAFGYAIIFWGINAIQGKDQPPFMTYVFPFGKNASGNSGIGGLDVKPPAGALGPITQADVNKMKNKPATSKANTRKKQNP